jgi:hypothetical protein
MNDIGDHAPDYHLKLFVDDNIGIGRILCLQLPLLLNPAIGWLTKLNKPY